MKHEESKKDYLKRGFDILFSFATILFFFPVFALIAFVISITSKGPAIYSHRRIGRNGKAFDCYKFRTMYFDAASRLQELLENDPSLQEEWQKTFKLKNDPRITPIGNFLRRTSLDELPQFFNVLKGDLSVVGPRPVVQEEIDRYFGEKSKIILSVRPGLTGLWQVSGRSDITSYAERIRLDEEYVQSRSLWFDLCLIAKTIPVMIKSRGAY